jgi:hypothetical protein
VVKTITIVINRPIHKFQAPPTKYSTAKLHIYINHEEIDLPNNLPLPTNTHKMAHKTPTIDNKTNPLFLLALLTLAAPLAATTLILLTFILILLAASTLMLLTFILILLKLDIRSKALLTNGFSEADAGVVGMDSTKPHKAEENQPSAASPSFPP